MKQTEGIYGVSDLMHHYGIIVPFFTGIFALISIIFIMYIISMAIEAIQIRLQDRTLREKVENILAGIFVSVLFLISTFSIGYWIADTFK